MQSQSEVERARARLHDAQSILALVRRMGECAYDLPSMERAKEDVVAALSWVWDAQQREIIREGESALAMIIRKAIDPDVLAAMQNERGIMHIYR